MTKANRALKVAYIDAQSHKRIINKYIVTRSLYESYQVKFEDAPTLVKVFSFGTLTGTKELEIDSAVYERKKRVNRQQVGQKLNGVFSAGLRCMPGYQEYIKSLQRQTRVYLKLMNARTREILEHNNRQADIAGAFGKGYSAVKAGADFGVSALASSNAIGPVGQGIGYLYGVSTETISAVSDADKANVWSFKGTISAPYVMAANSIAKQALKNGAKGKVVLAATGTKRFLKSLNLFLICNDLKNNWKSFN